MSQHKPLALDLSHGKEPETFFTCQIADPMGVERWRYTTNVRDFTKPENSWCALTAISMALKLKGRTPPSLGEMWEMACDDGVYRLFEDGRIGWQGAFVTELPGHMRKRYGLRSMLERQLNVLKLAERLRSGHLAMPNVSSAIRFPRDTREPEKKSGHFVLVYGVDVTCDGDLFFRVQNGCGFASKQSQLAVPISERRMRQVLSGTAILIY